MCSILTNRLNGRCTSCAIIRRNEQRREIEEIRRRQRKKPPKDLSTLVKNLTQKNTRLETKVGTQSFFTLIAFLIIANYFLAQPIEAHGYSFKK